MTRSAKERPIHAETDGHDRVAGRTRHPREPGVHRVPRTARSVGRDDEHGAALEHREHLAQRSRSAAAR